jgi:hypothetical protein
MHQPMHGKLLIPLILLALLLGAAVARADSAEPPAIPSTFEEATEFEAEEEGDEEESAEEECEEGEEEFEEGEVSREELNEDCERQRKRSEPGPGGILPEECLVRTFSSSAVANPDRNTVDLMIHYTTFEPTAATIAYDLGSSHIATTKRHLGSSGVIHLDKHLSDSQMSKLLGAHKLAVQIDVPATPGSCQRYYSDSAKLHLR